MHRLSLRNRPTRRRGIVIVLTAAVLSVLFLCATLAVDLGHIHAVACEMQNTADAAALAGAGVLTEDSSEAAYHTALEFIARNQRPQGFSSLEDQVVELGTWNSVTRTFSSLAESGAATAYAIRVVSHRTETPYFFASLIGKYSADVYREATTIGGGKCKGIWGVEGVRIPGNVYTDSYDSTAGLYDPATAGSDGDVCSGRGIDGMGSVEVHGDMMTGLGYWPTLAGNAGIFPAGITTSSIDGMVAPYVEVPAGMVNEGPLDLVADQNLDLAPGSYLFDSITMRAGASITISGPTTIYVDSLSMLDGSVKIKNDGGGDVVATGKGFINTTQNPHNLTLVILGDDAILNGTEAFYGTVIAPNADLVLSGTSDFYGTGIARTVLMRGDFQIHIDESLPAHDLIQPPPPMLVR